jgi:hypothetical protein
VRVSTPSAWRRPQTSVRRRRRLTIRPRSRARSARSPTSRAESGAVARRRARRRIHLPRTERERRRLGARRAASAEQRLDARHQLGHRERLRQIVVGATAEPLEDVRLLAARGQHEDRLRRARRAELATHVEAALVRQHDVEEDEGIGCGEGAAETVRAGLDAVGRVAVVGEHVAQAGADRGLVLHHQDPQLLRHRRFPV